MPKPYSSSEIIKALEKEKFLKNPLTILQAEAVFLALQRLWVNNHLNVKNPEKLVLDFFEWLKTSNVSKGHLMSKDKREIRDFYGKLLKENKTEDIDQDFKKDMLAQLIEKELSAAETILDFGCGKLAFLKNIGDNNKNIQKLIGVDSKSQPNLDGLDSRISFERDLEVVTEASVNLAIIKMVLHHIESDVAIAEILQNIQKTLKPGGRLIIFEESFSCHSERSGAESRNLLRLDPSTSSGADFAQDDICNVKKYLAGFKLELAEEATADFLKLNNEEKKQYLFLNDWLINLQNKYMPWAGQYKSMEDWVELVESVGFSSVEKHFIGAIAKRKRKQGMTAVMIFGN